MAYIQGETRSQMTLNPMCLDDYIGEDNICRVIEIFVNVLDLESLGFKYATPKETGRPPYNPACILKLYIYGYLHRIRSSRRLEAETQKNIEVMWLMEKLTPDDKTISNFRKDNAKTLKKVFRKFSLWCNEEDLYGRELLGVDGTKFRANANRNSIYTQKGTKTRLSEVEKKIIEYMNELEKNDNNEISEANFNAEKIACILKNLNEKKETLQGWLEKIDENGGKEISTVDPDTCLMHTNGDGRSLDACYNVQTVSDSKHKLIVDFNVSTSPDDKDALVEMSESAKEIMSVSEINTAADKGYYDGEDIAICEEAGTRCFIPKTESTGRSAPNPKYSRKHFKYDRKNDSYICPEGKRLIFKGIKKRSLKSHETEEDRKYDRFYSNKEACLHCKHILQCTKNKRGREMFRNQNQDTLDAIDARMETDLARNIFQKRREIIEHQFGTTKAVWGFRQFLCRGHEMATAEMSLIFLAYNFRRIINIFKGNGKNLREIMA